jgi:hypothetical protein
MEVKEFDMSYDDLMSAYAEYVKYMNWIAFMDDLAVKYGDVY